jgi:hypothetical protein
MMRKIWCFVLIPQKIYLKVMLSCLKRLSGAEMKKECVLKAREEHDYACVRAHICHSGCLIEAIFHCEEWKCVSDWVPTFLGFLGLVPFPPLQGTVQNIDVFFYVSLLLILHIIQSPVMLQRPLILVQCTLFLYLWKLDFSSTYRTPLISPLFSFVCAVRKKLNLHTCAFIYHTNWFSWNGVKLHLVANFSCFMARISLF